MRKKRLIVAATIAILCAAAVFYRVWSAPDGSTRESREVLLQNVPKGISWHIVTEQTQGEYLLCGMTGSDGRVGIAVFAPEGEGYRLISREWRMEPDDIVISGYMIEQTWYTIVWFHGAQTEKAELTYQEENGTKSVFTFETGNMEIVVSPAPVKNYTLHVAYFDEEGNRYE